MLIKTSSTFSTFPSFKINRSTNRLLALETSGKAIDYFIYIIYSGLYIYLLFNIIDSVAAVHSEQAEKRNKAYNKELVLLLVKSLKGQWESNQV
jgi:MscS family membrane protein